MITIRPVTPEDAEALGALARVSPETGHVQARPAFHADAYTATLAPVSGAQGLVACTSAGRVVGQIFWRPVQVLIGGQPVPAVHAFFLAVHPDFRRQGIGHRLTRAAWEAGRVAGAQLFYGMVQRGNRASIGNLRKLGCRAVGTLTRALVPLHRRPPHPSALRVRVAESADLPRFVAAANAFYTAHDFWSPLTVEGLQVWLTPKEGRIRRSLFVVQDAAGRWLAGVALSDETALRTGVVEQAPWPVWMVGRCLGLIDATGHMRFISAVAPWYRQGEERAARFLWEWLRWHLRRRATALLIDYDAHGPAARAVVRPWYLPVAHYHIYACSCAVSSPLSFDIRGVPLISHNGSGPTRFVAIGFAT